jgi:hypothetical protein
MRKLTPRGRVYYEKLAVAQLINKFPCFMEPVDSSLCSEYPGSIPYFEPMYVIAFPFSNPLYLSYEPEAARKSRFGGQ